MKIVVGLGNPGREYVGTRHNIGFEVVDWLATRVDRGWETGPATAMQARWRRGGADQDVLLVKPLTFMNLSGEAVGALMRFYKVAVPDVLIVCDDVNLPLGRLRARASGSEGGHNGLRSIAQQLGTDRVPAAPGRRGPRRHPAGPGRPRAGPVRRRGSRCGGRGRDQGRRSRGLVDRGRLGQNDEFVQPRRAGRERREQREERQERETDAKHDS